MISVAAIICCGPRAELTARPSPTVAAITAKETAADDDTAVTLLESADLPDEFRLLQIELNDLQQQMLKLDRLLNDRPADPEVSRLTESLRTKTDLLHRRRKTLITLWANAVKEEREREVAEP